MTYTVTHQTTHILPPAGTQNALDESHKKPSAQQAARRTGVLARCQRAHGARLGRWRSQKHRWWPSAGVSGGGRDLTLRADDPTSRGTTQPGPITQPNPKSTILKLGPQPLSPLPSERCVRVEACACRLTAARGWHCDEGLRAAAARPPWFGAARLPAAIVEARERLPGVIL